MLLIPLLDRIDEPFLANVLGEADGNAVGGQGELVSVSLEDPNLVVTDSSGSTTKRPEYPEACRWCIRLAPTGQVWLSEVSADSSDEAVTPGATPESGTPERDRTPLKPFFSL